MLETPELCLRFRGLGFRVGGFGGLGVSGFRG